MCPSVCNRHVWLQKVGLNTKIVVSNSVLRNKYISKYILVFVDSSGRAVQAVGLRPLACSDCGFESGRWHGCLSLVRVVCCEKRYNNYLHLQPVGRKSSEQEKKERNKENYSGSFNKTEQLSIQTINKFSPHATLLETK